MARRRSTPRRQGVRPLPVECRIEVGPDGYDYEVRPVAGSRATKTYRCPGCNQEIAVGMGHLVVVPLESPDLRRHWHFAVWATG